MDNKHLHETNQLVDSKKLLEINCEKDFLFVLSEEVGFSSTEYKVLNSIWNTGLLRCKRIRYNGKIALFYCTDTYKPLEVLLPTLDANQFLLILENLINKISEIKENGFLMDTRLDVRINKIYVDMSDEMVYLAYLPLTERCYEDVIYLEEQLRSDLAYLIRSVPNIQSPNIMYLAQMMEEPACSFSNLLSAIRQNRSVSMDNGRY